MKSAVMQQSKSNGIQATNHPHPIPTVQSTGMINDATFLFHINGSSRRSVFHWENYQGTQPKKMSKLYISVKKSKPQYNTDNINLCHGQFALAR